MKTRYGTVDLMAVCQELQEKLVGMRVNQIYDIDKKTYLIRFQRTEEKAVLIIESGTRIHLTNYEWPKQPAPSGFTMKLRKHIKNKRLETLSQLGVDRIVDMQFGTGEASYHVILELYDRGNIIFTDHEYTILNLLRPRFDNEDQRIAVGEKYPMDKVRNELRSLDVAEWEEAISKAKPNDNLKKLLNPRLDFGPSMIEHCLLGAGFPANAGIEKGYKHPEDAQRLLEAVKSAAELCHSSSFKGYIIQKVEKRLKPDGSGEEEDFFTYQEYHPHKYRQFDSSPVLEFPDFSAAVDEFYSKLENQKVDLKVVQQEKLAMKKLENVIKDRENRLAGLEEAQELDRRKGEMIQMNLDLVEKALLVLRSAIANQMSWEEIAQMVKDAQSRGDPIASTIKQLRLDINHFTMALRDPYDAAHVEEEEEQEEKPVENDDEELSDKSEAEEEEKPGGDEPAKEEEEVGKKKKKAKGKQKQKKKEKGGKDKKKKGEEGFEKGRKDGVTLVDIDIALSAFANARKYYDQKRYAAQKQQKTLESTEKAFKSAQKKTKQVLKEVQAIASVNKARKPMWFEKFYWFISSENYLVIGGRDQQQNELIVKRYLKQNDIYVHADLHGASTVVIKNPKEGAVPPKTLNEAGTMAICYSSAWDAKVITNAWWVYANQVSKTAPTGEYLTTGSFMIRGKKNLLMPSHLIMGFGFLFKLEESSMARHKGERRVKTAEEEAENMAQDVAEGLDADGATGDVDIPVEEGEDDDEDEEKAAEGEEGKADLEQILEEDGAENGEEGEEKNFDGDEEVSGDEDAGKSGSDEDEKNEAGDQEEEEYVEKVEATPAKVEIEFPDTKVNVVGDKLETKGIKVDSPQRYEEDFVVYLGDDKPLVIKPSEQRKKQQQQQQKAKQPQQQNNAKDNKAGGGKGSQQQQNATAAGDAANDSQKPFKRGQKAKMKRVKEKYKDQDEDERKLRMEILHQSISGKELNPKTKRGKKAKAMEKQKEDEKRRAERAAQMEAKEKQKQAKAKAQKEDGGEDLDVDDDEDDKKELDDLSFLDSFTGAPVAEDELLFALPVVAPYAVFINYKYKLKMTPGGAKRGKASKTALGIFVHDKSATQREKDLLKCVKEHDLTRNFPGKVKLSATTQQRKR